MIFFCKKAFCRLKPYFLILRFIEAQMKTQTFFETNILKYSFASIPLRRTNGYYFAIKTL